MAASADHHVEFAPVHRLQQFARNADPHAEGNARIAHRERLHDIHQPDVGEVFGQANPDRTFAGPAKQLRMGIMVERENGARVAQQKLTVRRERHRARGTHEQVPAGLFFQTSQMRANRGLRQIEARRGVREPAFLDDGHEGAQQNGIEHGPSNTVRIELNKAVILRLYFRLKYVVMTAVTHPEHCHADLAAYRIVTTQDAICVSRRCARLSGRLSRRPSGSSDRRARSVVD
ncbi:hypothetical protein PCAR4_170095 [Paraburkholderia caribensis]|nr:hypothetical protein PCAR4_170095 [Paraburkholderia caribensis]